MAKRNNNSPSLEVLMTQAVDHCSDLRPRLDALSEMVQIDCGEILEDAKIDLQTILKVLNNNPTDETYSGLFQEPDHFQKQGIEAIEECDIDPANPLNDQAYLRLFADLAANFFGLSREDQQSITHSNGRDEYNDRYRSNKSLPEFESDATISAIN